VTSRDDVLSGDKIRNFGDGRSFEWPDGQHA
jgi:hypothetical protein